MPAERLDRTDRAIVAALQNNARISNKELAEEIGLAPSTCLERVRALRTRGVILGYHARVDREALGRGLEAIIAVRIRPHSREAVNAFRRWALAQPETIEVFYVSGADDYLVHVAVAGAEALRDLILDQVAARPEVGHVETHLVFDHERRPVLEPLYDRVPRG